MSNVEDYLFARREHSSVNAAVFLSKDGRLWRRVDAVPDLQFISKIHKFGGSASEVAQTTNSEVIAIRHGLLMERFNPVYKQPPAFYVHRDVCLLIKNSSLLFTEFRTEHQSLRLEDKPTNTNAPVRMMFHR